MTVTHTFPASTLATGIWHPDSGAGSFQAQRWLLVARNPLLQTTSAAWLTALPPPSPAQLESSKPGLSVLNAYSFPWKVL